MGASRKDKRRFSFGSLREWHWISSAVCLIGMLLFAITGITLNHAAQIKAKPKIVTTENQLPKSILAILTESVRADDSVPTGVQEWLAKNHGIPLTHAFPEWSSDELYLSLPRPGGDAWLSIDLTSGEWVYEVTDRGWISYFNDLHKGRNTGKGWSWFIDIFSVACIVFCVTGLLLLKRYSRGRPLTWPVVGVGLVLPWILILLSVH
jgi:uncharacterized protein